jgi:streptogramin lyase
MRKRPSARLAIIGLAAVLLLAATACQPPPVGTITDYGLAMGPPKGIVTGPDGNLWFTTPERNTISRLVPALGGFINTYTGPGISTPYGITVGPDGNLWFTNNGNNSIGRITTAGVVTNFTGTSIDHPRAITAGADGNLWFVNNGNNSIGRIDRRGRLQLHRHRHQRRTASLRT